MTKFKGNERRKVAAEMHHTYHKEQRTIPCCPTCGAPRTTDYSMGDIAKLYDCSSALVATMIDEHRNQL